MKVKHRGRPGKPGGDDRIKEEKTGVALNLVSSLLFPIPTFSQINHEGRPAIFFKTDPKKVSLGPNPLSKWAYI
jgi:hypothetical protein